MGRRTVAEFENGRDQGTNQRGAGLSDKGFWNQRWALHGFLLRSRDIAWFFIPASEGCRCRRSEGGWRPSKSSYGILILLLTEDSLSHSVKECSRNHARSELQTLRAMFLIISTVFFQCLVRLVEIMHLLNSLPISMLKTALENFPLIANQVR